MTGSPVTVEILFKEDARGQISALYWFVKQACRRVYACETRA